MTAYDTLPPPPRAVIAHLEAALQEIGGELLEDPCRAMTLPAVPNRGVPEGYTCSCGGQTRVAFPYPGEHGAHFVTCCVVCDGVWRMPLHNRPPIKAD